MKRVQESYIWLLAGIGVFGFGVVKFWELAVAPQMTRLTGGK